MKEAEGHANAVHAVLNLEEQENRSTVRCDSAQAIMTEAFWGRA